MANEKRLIDADDALRMMKNSRHDNPYLGTMASGVWELAHDCGISCVDACPTVDAVEVVRCEDCKHYRTSGCAMDTYAFDVVEEGFCSYGERRTEC